MTETIAQVSDPFRTGKAYTIAQAAALAQTSAGTIRNWLFGDPDRMEPVLIGRSRNSHGIQRVSFLELLDLVVVARYRRWRIDLEKIREAHKFAQREWELAYPFASLNLLPLGGHVLRQYEELQKTSGQFVVMTSPGQFVLPEIVQDAVRNFDFDSENQDPFATRWHCYGRDVPVVVDPHFGGGMPTVEGSGVTVDIIVKRRKAGETKRSIANDFNLPFSTVDQVLKHAA